MVAPRTDHPPNVGSSPDLARVGLLNTSFALVAKQSFVLRCFVRVGLLEMSNYQQLVADVRRKPAKLGYGSGAKFGFPLHASYEVSRQFLIACLIALVQSAVNVSALQRAAALLLFFITAWLIDSCQP
jgi:hypothetical protein